MNKRILCSVMVILMFLSLFIFPVTSAGTASITAVYADGVVSVNGSGFENGASYTLRVVNVVNSSVEAMGQTIANGSGNISASITTGVLNTLTNFTVYVNSSNGQLVASVTSVDTIEPTDGQKVATDKEALTADLIRGENTDIGHVTKNLNLVSSIEGGAGSTITWASDNTSVVAANGTVVRPATADSTVNLTATITNGIAQDQKKFIVTVLRTGSGTPPDPDPGAGSGSNSQPSVPGVIKATPVYGSDGTAKATINSEDVEKALAEAAEDKKGIKTVRIELSALEGAARYGVEISSEILIMDKTTNKFEIVTPKGTLLVAGNTFKPGEFKVGTKVELSIGKADVSSLSSKDKVDIGTRPVIDLNVKVNGEIYEKGNFKSPVTISIPYTPSAAESKKPEHITVMYIDKDNKVSSIPNGKYEAATGLVTFTVKHFSKYAVAFVNKSFADISNSWAREKIEVLASKGITAGTSETTYSPKKNITRGDFLVLLMKTLELEAEITSNFDDVSVSDYYYVAIGIAKQLGITAGVGNNLFNPKESISREDMMVLTAKALIVAGKINQDTNASTLSGFTDNATVAAYAKASVAALVEEGIISGSDNKINPKGLTTREEMASVIYKIYYR